MISSWGGTRKLPFAFTEQVLAMFSGICPQFCGDINNIIRNLKGYAESPTAFLCRRKNPLSLELLNGKLRLT